MADDNARFRVTYWGVRGSIPTPGPDTVRYGGNTTCLEVRCDDRVIVIDTGTGARRLGARLLREADGAPLRVAVLYSHLHLDHIQGFPFFGPIYHPTSVIDVYAAQPDRTTVQAVLQTQMTYPSFPVGLDRLACALTFHTVTPGEAFALGDVRVRTCPIAHPGGALALRIEHRGRAFVQCSDMEHAGPAPEPEVVDFARGADVLSYDSTYVAGAEYAQHQGWGHSTWQHGVGIADAAGVRRFVAFHHDPGHDDAFMDGVAAELEAARPGSVVAREGLSLDLLAGTVEVDAPLPAG